MLRVCYVCFGLVSVSGKDGLLWNLGCGDAALPLNERTQLPRKYGWLLYFLLYRVVSWVFCLFLTSSPAILSEDCGTVMRTVRCMKNEGRRDDADGVVGGHDGQATKGGGNKDDNPCPPMVIRGIGSVAACKWGLRWSQYDATIKNCRQRQLGTVSVTPYFHRASNQQC